MKHCFHTWKFVYDISRCRKWNSSHLLLLTLFYIIKWCFGVNAPFPACHNRAITSSVRNPDTTKNKCYSNEKQNLIEKWQNIAVSQRTSERKANKHYQKLYAETYYFEIDLASGLFDCEQLKSIVNNCHYHKVRRNKNNNITNRNRLKKSDWTLLVIAHVLTWCVKKQLNQEERKQNH